MYLLTSCTESRSSIIIFHGPTSLEDLGDDVNHSVLSRQSRFIKSYSPSEVLAAADAGASWPYFLGLVHHYDNLDNADILPSDWDSELIN